MTHNCVRSHLLTWEYMPICSIPILNFGMFKPDLWPVEKRAFEKGDSFCVLHAVAGFGEAKVVKLINGNYVKMRL